MSINIGDITYSIGETVTEAIKEHMKAHQGEKMNTELKLCPINRMYRDRCPDYEIKHPSNEGRTMSSETRYLVLHCLGSFPKEKVDLQTLKISGDIMRGVKAVLEAHGLKVHELVAY